MFKFGRKDKTKSDDKKKERKDSKKEKKSRDSISGYDNELGEPRYSQLTKSSKNAPSGSSNVSSKNGGKSSAVSRGILKIRGSSKHKTQNVPPSNLDEAEILRQNTRINEEFAWRTSPDAKSSYLVDRKKRESIHSITMNIAPPSVPPPASATEKVYDVDLKLPSITPAPPMETRRLVISRQPTGDFGFNLRWAPYTNIATGVTHHAVHAEPGSSGSKSGVIAGDRIVEINGKNVEECSRDVVIASIQQSPDPLNLVVQQLVGVSELHRFANPPVTALYVNNSPEFKVNNNGDVSPLINGHENSGEENYWLIHKGGYSSCKLIQSATTDGRCKVKLEQGGHILEVDENDLEKVNLPSLDRCEDLSSLAYLNESSLLHVLRQRYGSSLVHTVSGPSLLLINPNTSLNIYSHKVMQMVRACNYSELPPHVYSKAQYVYQEMITTCRDQCIVLSGRTGSGKSTSMRHMLNYYGHVYAGSQQLAIDEKYSSALTVLEALGNYSTQSNTNASGFVHHVTIDFDHYGFIASSSFQVSLLEKSRIVNIPKGETTFHIFQYVLYGLDNSQRQELHLLSNEGLIDTVYSPPSTVDPEDAVGNWNKLEHSLRMLSVTPEEIKAIQHVVAAIIHLRVAGVTKGSNNKTYFADPASAQNAANLLGVNAEDLAKSIFSYSPSTLSSQSNLRPSAVEETLSGGADALDEFIVGIYTQLLTLVVYLINRNLSTVTRNCTSITILDTPGFRDSTSQPATFNHLCYNYINERIQLLFYEKIFTENKERYIQENIEVELDDFTDRPEAMVNLLDKPSNQQQLLQGTGSANSRIDLSLIGRDESADLGLFWILDQMSMTPGATEEQFLDKVDLAHGRAVDQCEKLLTLHPHHPSLFSLNHYYGTAQVTYQCAGWLKTCRLYSNTEQASSLLQSSQKSSIAELFNLTSSSLVSSFTSGAGNMSTLHRSNSLRRQYVNQAGLKRKSQSMSVKYQMDSLLDKISKMAVHFVIHLVPNSQDRQRSHIGTAPLTGDMVLDVPYIRLQIRGMQLLPAVRFHRQGYPEHLTFNEFIRRYSLLCGEDASYSVPLVDQKAVVEEVLATAGVDKSQYRIGLSQVFIRPDTLAQLNRLRELRRSLYAIVIQKYIRRYLAQKAIVKLKLKHEAMRCIQKNIRINFKLEDWQWWKLYTKIKPLVNVQQTEETLKAKEAELFQLKSQLEKVENERNAYKKECARFEDEAVRFQSESVQERQVSRQAVELLEQETSSRLSLESQLNDVVVSHEDLQKKIELLEKENEELRQVHESYEESHHDVPDGSFITQSKYEHMVKENELRRRQLLTEHEEEIEEFKHTKHKLERQVQELVLEKNEQGQVIGNLKKKVQKYSNEAQDLKRQYEDSEARNFELEKRQRRFDSELQLKAGDMAGEKSMKAHLQKERDQLLTQKYSLTQQLEDVTIERDALQTKLHRLEHEMTELKSSGGGGDSELIQLRSVKHALERKLAESEDEIGDLQQEMHEVEMAKLKIQMEVDKLKQKHQKEIDQLERDLEEVRDTQARKTRNYESRIAELEEELHQALQERREAERKWLKAKDTVPVRDVEHEKELRGVIKRLRALLTDTTSQIEKLKEQNSQKSQYRAMETKLEDLQSNLTAALKSKQSLEVDLQQCQHQISAANKSKVEAEDRASKLMREKNDIENEKEDLDEEIHELLKRYQTLVSQNTVNTMKLKDQTEQISSLSETKSKLQEELDSANSKLAHLDSHFVPKDRISILEFKVLEIEQKLEYEKSVRVRFENQALKAKDNCDKLDDEISKLNMKIADEERRGRQLQNQLSRTLESLESVNRKDIEQTQTISSLTQKVELCDSEVHQLQVDLKSAQKRADNLQAELAHSILTDDEDEEFSTDSESGYN